MREAVAGDTDLAVIGREMVFKATCPDEIAEV